MKLAEMLKEFHSQTCNLSCAEFAKKYLYEPLEKADIESLKALCEQFDITVPTNPLKADLVNLRACSASYIDCSACNVKRDNCYRVIPYVEDNHIKARSQLCNLRRVQSIIENSGIPAKFTDCRAGSFTVTAENRAVALLARNVYKTKSPRKGLFIFGGVGSGKTMLTSIIIIERAFLGQPSLFYTVTDMLSDLKDFSDSVSRQVKLNKLKSVPCLAIDDLGAEYVTDWVSSTLFEILDARYKSNLCTIINSNFSTDGLVKRYGQVHGNRIVRRICELCDLACLT